ncbi:MAG: glucose-6-phosphate dehydrogenase assembly protein OpcA [Oscillatoria sp. PMC 1068.18]|nr:glucose-6-phosphate dehydrogenase assembly protein OpcA [Oscillatoria sp. PMC 1076.18]MEC4987167.1 glucose-6-phosphate dehydrogenase assembly protein OpcA [Oscillatoria sp. PMC 1068.18]
MTTTSSPPIVSLQSPKDVSIDYIEKELREIWQSYSTGDENFAATRATTFTLVVYEPEESQQLLAALGFYTGPIDGIAGPRTIAALKAAQKAYGLEVTAKPSEALLSKLREEYTKAKESGSPTEENGTVALKYSPDLEGGAVADAIAAANPCRIITLCPIVGEDEGVTAQVSAYCPIQKQSKSSLICCEYITLRGTAEALERVGGIISELMIGELPKFVWWKATPDPEFGLFKRLMASGDSLIIDSSSFNKTEADLAAIAALMKEGTAIADLNWRRLAAWQELTAEAFDPPERRAALTEVDKVTIDYEKGNQAQALMYLGWLGSRLQWKPVSYEKEGGDYDIRRVKFTTEDHREIEAELAGIPTADWGEIAGDLISLRLSSTNLNADCCTVLCSETTGCMRMEAGGGAQACRIQQVTPLFDQKTEKLLSQQLQRWGREVLYEESLAVTGQILHLIED